MMRGQTKPVLAGAVIAVMLLPLAPMANGAYAGPAQQRAAPATNGSIEVLPARDLMNRPVRDPQGRDAGRIDGIILNTENGAVDFVIIAGSGNFNLNGNVIAVPWDVLAPPTTGQGPIEAKVSAEKLAQGPQLNSHMINSLEQPRTRGNVYGYWGWGWGAPYRGYGGPYGPGAGRPVPAGYGPANAGVFAPGPSGEQHEEQPQLTSNGLFVNANGAISTLQSADTSSANAMRSAPVFASGNTGGYAAGGWAGGPNNGATVGEIRDVMIDPWHGEVAFVLIERGGFLGLKPRWYALPPEALAWAPYRGGYDLTVNEQLLNTAPPLQHANSNAPNGPVRVPANQLAQLYQHFDITPYWEQGTAGSNPRNTAGSAGANSGSSQQPANPK